MIEKPVTVYVAEDGREFTDCESCRQYEAKKEMEAKIEEIRSRLHFTPIERGNTKESPERFYAYDSIMSCFFYGNDTATDLYNWHPESREEIQLFLEWREKLEDNGAPKKRTELVSPELARWVCYADELEPLETYIVGIKDNSYVSVLNRAQVLEAVDGMFDGILGIGRKKKPVYIWVMNYAIGSIKKYVVEMLPGASDEAVKNWLYEHTDFTETDCYYMSSNRDIPLVEIDFKTDAA